MQKTLDHLFHEKFLTVLVLLALGFVFSGRLLPERAIHVVEWRTVGTLFGLLLLSCGLEQSGYLHRFGHQLLKRLPTERRVAAFFVVSAAAMATVITNDISLFIVIPLALEVGRSLKGYPTGRLIIFVALAVNVGSSLTAVGNPQNIFLWQTSHVSFVQFAETMLPFAGSLFLVLLFGVFFAFRPLPLVLNNVQIANTLDSRLFTASILLYPVFLTAVDNGFIRTALLVVLLVFLFVGRKAFRRLDWALLAVFVFMFIDFKSIAALPLVQSLALQALHWKYGAFKSGLLFSQVLSNVPATILLQSFHPLWRELAWGVAVGGFGLAIGSLANLIALRLARIKRLWVEFHVWSLAMFAVSFLIGLVLLHIVQP